VTDVDPTKGLIFGETNLAIQAAIEGQGVVLSSDVLGANDIAAGRLVRLFDVRVSGQSGYGYFVVAPKATAQLPKVVAFRDWLLSEAAATLAPAAAKASHRRSRARPANRP